MPGFPRNTLVTTDQGDVFIQNIDTRVHTINGDTIAAVTSTTVEKDKLVCFVKDAFKPGYPISPTFMTPDHHIFFLGRMCPAEKFVGTWGGVGMLENYDGIVYNVMTAEHRLMLVNQLTCETGYFYAPNY
jgi:hypothetical protein